MAGEAADNRFVTIGPVVRSWIEAHCVVPDGPQMGAPFRLTREMERFIDALCAVDLEATVRGQERARRDGLPDPLASWVYPRGGQLVRPQKWGKGPFSAAWVSAEAAGPVLPLVVGGEVVECRPWDTPWIQITAVSEDQTANVFRALLPMIQLSSTLNVLIPDSGLTRINTPGGGLIEPVTASARSRLGQRITAAVNDETHSWLQSNGGRKLADNQRRNLSGMGGRFLETTNAWNRAEMSVAQQTFEEKGVLIDFPRSPSGSIRNRQERRRVLRAVYGDSYWVNLDRVDDEIEALLLRDPAQAERFFLNRLVAAEDSAFDIDVVESRERRLEVPDREVIVIGVDGALREDSIGVVACHVKSGHMWTVAVVERPENAPDDYQHDLRELDGAVTDLFERYDVWRLYADPHYIEQVVDGWSNRYGERRVVHWLTYRHRPIAWAVRDFEQAIATGEMSHDGHPKLVEHLGNCQKKTLTVRDEKERFMHTLQKDSPRSSRKIDLAMAAVLAWQARGDCVAAGRVRLVDTKLSTPSPIAVPQVWVPGTAPSWDNLPQRSDDGPLGPMS